MRKVGKRRERIEGKSRGKGGKDRTVEEERKKEDEEGSENVNDSERL